MVLKFNSHSIPMKFKSDLKKMNYDFNEKYIFQVKKNNLKTFSAVAELIETHYPENKKISEIYPWDLVNIIFSKQKKLTNEIRSE